MQVRRCDIAHREPRLHVCPRRRTDGVRHRFTINTYRGHGVAKPGFYKHDVDAHAIIHDRHLRAHADINEPIMSKRPISVAMSLGESLHPMSRIDFSTVHIVHHHIKAKQVGRISPESMSDFSKYWSAQMKGQLSRSAIGNIALARATSEAP